ncbi:hypothetical protein, partial [Erwinia sp.]|uniref:hypothetical protein n=1 Tax=Erwinia citreus TaxID=558 RepID=UPI00289D76E6
IVETDSKKSSGALKSLRKLHRAVREAIPRQNATCKRAPPYSSARALIGERKMAARLSGSLSF